MSQPPEFDPQLLFRTYLDLLPKRIDPYPPPTVPTRKRMRFHEAMGLTPATAAIIALQYHDSELEPEEFELVVKLVEGITPSEAELDVLDEMSRRLYFAGAEEPKKPKEIKGHKIDFVVEDDLRALEPTETVIREAAVKALPPAGETGAVIDDAWWTKLKK